MRGLGWKVNKLLGLALLLLLGRIISLAPLALEVPYRGFEGREHLVRIPKGATGAQIADSLARQGVIRWPLYFELLIRWHGAGAELQAGTYAFSKESTPREVLRRLIEGDVVKQNFVVPEGSNSYDIARAFAQAGLGSEQQFLNAAKATYLIADLDPEATDLEGYLFPDTYQVVLGESAMELVKKMVGQFRQQLSGGLLGWLRVEGRSLREVVTLASLVEEETGVAEERALIAAVFLNRLRHGIRLQCDPTVLFALQRAGRSGRELSRADLEFPSTYNTYLRAGLPPGPIASPGRASLEAALQPASVPYLYFVAGPDGGHRFSATLEEHNRQVFSTRRQRRASERDG